MRPHPVLWAAPAPLWPERRTADALRAPALVALDGDAFMDALTAAVAAAPGDLSPLRALQATPVSFANPLPGETAAPTPTSLKFYQPAHGRYQLVLASLVCQLAGLPEHRVGKGDLSGFVLRRLEPKGSGYTEYGWIPDGPTQPQGGSWVATTEGALARTSGAGAREEEVIPVFPLRWRQGERLRTVWAGLIPTASRETRLAAATTGADELPPRRDVLEMQLRGRFFDPFLAEVEHALTQDDTEAFTAALEQLAWTLAELWQILSAPDAFGPLGTQSAPSAGAAALRTALSGSAFLLYQPPAGPCRALGLWDAMFVAVAAVPKLADGSFTGLFYTIQSADYLAADLFYGGAHLLGAILDALAAATAAAPPTTSRVPRLSGGDDVRWQVRMVYRRDRCDHRSETALSDPSERFVLAGYHDPDAPAREVRIPLPADTSIAALRRARRGVGFVFSPELQQKMKRLGPLEDLMEGKLKDGGSGISFGEICSFSIPIITLVAMIILMIFVILLNFVFWWLPFLRICLPIPKSEASK